jgi:glycosyltransferase involved in cell wall biosynthesis
LIFPATYYQKIQEIRLIIGVFPAWLDNNSYLPSLYDAVSNAGASVRFLDKLGSSTCSDLDILHLHWIHHKTSGRSSFEKSYRSWRFLRKVRHLKKSHGLKVVWTVHNLTGHEERFSEQDRHFRQALAASCDQLLVHTESGAGQVTAHLGMNLPLKVIEHASYTGTCRTDTTREQVRREMDIPSHALVAVNIGNMRPYKGMKSYLEAAGKVDREDLYLILAGPAPDPHHRDELARLADHPRVTSRFSHVAGEEMARLLAASDLFLAPTGDIMTSGSVILAMSYSLAVLGPRSGFIREMCGDNGALYHDGDAASIARTLANLTTEQAQTMGRHNCQRIEPFTWQRMASETVKVYEELLASSF